MSDPFNQAIGAIAYARKKLLSSDHWPRGVQSCSLVSKKQYKLVKEESHPGTTKHA